MCDGLVDGEVTIMDDRHIQDSRLHMHRHSDLDKIWV
jgi:hypothetical protein